MTLPNCEKKVDENIKIWYHINTDKEEFGSVSDASAAAWFPIS